VVTQDLQPILNTRDESPFRFLGLPTVVRATSQTTNGAFGLIEHLMPPGFASPHHTHHLEDEAFYVLEGHVAFVCGGKWLTAGPGAYVFGPRNIPHGFKVLGAVPARMLLLCAPAGFEQFVLDMSEPEPVAEAPLAPLDMAKLVALAAKCNIDILGPLPDADTSLDPLESDAAVIDRVREAHVAALNAGDAAGWAGVFTTDAVQMPPNAPANIGRANIRSWAEAFLGAFSVSFSLSVTELQVVGDRAIESGAYTIAMTPHAGGPAMEDVGKYITVYQRDGAGDWAVARDIWNSDRPVLPMR
jgi:uncharacterized protein (TIGR02246 family)